MHKCTEISPEVNTTIVLPPFFVLSLVIPQTGIDFLKMFRCTKTTTECLEYLSPRTNNNILDTLRERKREVEREYREREGERERKRGREKEREGEKEIENEREREKKGK